MKKKDLILIVSVLATALCILAVMKLTQKSGNVAVVQLEDSEYARLELNKDAELKIETERGMNLIVVENGHVYMKEADCPDKICENEGKISQVGEVIVCLPHRIIISVEANEQ